ncbi:MAG: hypothetical protein WA139_02585 [Candidatus Aenigmatarchaeota archaeon]
MNARYIKNLINDFLTVGIPLKNKRVAEAKKAIEPYLHNDEKYLIYELKDKNIKVNELEFIVSRYGIDRNNFIDETCAEMRNLQGNNNRWGAH